MNKQQEKPSFFSEKVRRGQIILEGLYHLIKQDPMGFSVPSFPCVDPKVARFFKGIIPERDELIMCLDSLADLDVLHKVEDGDYKFNNKCPSYFGFVVTAVKVEDTP